MSSTPPLAFIWNGASCTLELASNVRSRASSVSSQPTSTTGRPVGTRRGPDVTVLGERFTRALLPFGGDDVDVGRRGHARASLDLDEMLGLEELEDAEEDLREREADHIREIGRGGLTLLIEDLQDEIGDETLGETGLLDRDRSDRGGSLRG